MTSNSSISTFAAFVEFNRTIEEIAQRFNKQDSLNEADQKHLSDDLETPFLALKGFCKSRPTIPEAIQLNAAGLFYLYAKTMTPCAQSAQECFLRLSLLIHLSALKIIKSSASTHVLYIQQSENLTALTNKLVTNIKKEKLFEELDQEIERHFRLPPIKDGSSFNLACTLRDLYYNQQCNGDLGQLRRFCLFVFEHSTDPDRHYAAACFVQRVAHFVWFCIDPMDITGANFYLSREINPLLAKEGLTPRGRTLQAKSIYSRYTERMSQLPAASMSPRIVHTPTDFHFVSRFLSNDTTARRDLRKTPMPPCEFTKPNKEPQSGVDATNEEFQKLTPQAQQRLSELVDTQNVHPGYFVTKAVVGKARIEHDLRLYNKSKQQRLLKCKSTEAKMSLELREPTFEVVHRPLTKKEVIDRFKLDWKDITDAIVHICSVDSEPQTFHFWLTMKMRIYLDMVHVMNAHSEWKFDPNKDVDIDETVLSSEVRTEIWFLENQPNGDHEYYNLWTQSLLAAEFELTRADKGWDSASEYLDRFEKVMDKANSTQKMQYFDFRFRIAAQKMLECATTFASGKEFSDISRKYNLTMAQFSAWAEKGVDIYQTAFQSMLTSFKLCSHLEEPFNSAHGVHQRRKFSIRIVDAAMTVPVRDMPPLVN